MIADRMKRGLVAGAGAVLIGVPAWAQGDQAPLMADRGDTGFILLCAALVLFMTLPGLALFYGGLVRAKNFLSVLMTLLFLSVNGHLVLVDMLVRSYAVLPPGGAWLSPDRLKDIAFFGGYTFAAGLLLALPVGFLLLCLNMIVGMVSRAAPSLNLFAIGLPASLAVGVVALALAMPAMGDYMLVIVQEGLDAAQSLVFG